MARYIISAHVTDPQAGQEGRGGEQELRGAVQQGLQALGVIVDDLSVRVVGQRQQRAEAAQVRALEQELYEEQYGAQGGGQDQGLQQLQQGLEQQYGQVQQMLGQQGAQPQGQQARGFGQQEGGVPERELPRQGGFPPNYQLSEEVAETAEQQQARQRGGERG